MWFTSWAAVGRVVIGSLAALVMLLTFIRLGGSRSISSMNASDFIVTVAIGSTVAATALDPNVSLAAGLTAIAMLIGIQYTTMLISVKSPGMRARVEGQPILLVHKGRVVTEMMRRSKIGDIEVHQALREHGLASIEEAEAVVLEANGDFSIIARRAGRDDPPVLRDVRRP